MDRKPPANEGTVHAIDFAGSRWFSSNMSTYHATEDAERDGEPRL